MSEGDDQDDRAGTDESDSSSGEARARRLGKRYALLVFVGFAAAFIVLSTWEIVASVFSLDAPGGIAAHGKLSDGCAAQLRTFTGIIDHGVSASNPAEIGAINNAGLDSACTSSADLDALAAARRYERAVATSSFPSTSLAMTGSATRTPSSTRAEAIAPLRRDVEAYLAQ